MTLPYIFSSLIPKHKASICPCIPLLFHVKVYLGGILVSCFLLVLSRMAKISPFYDGASLDYKCICTKLNYDYHIENKCLKNGNQWE
jgi:hypothetical protein